MDKDDPVDVVGYETSLTICSIKAIAMGIREGQRLAEKRVGAQGIL
jgi:hypothetical protein